MKKYHHQQRRGGFTLIELLTVVAIIAFLTTISVMVMTGVADQAKEEATAATIRKIDGLLEARMEAFDRAFRQGGAFQQKYITATNALLALKNIYGVRPAVVTILARKVAFRHNFPQNHPDLTILGFAPDGVTPLTDWMPNDTMLPVASRTIDASGNEIADVVDQSAASGTTSSAVSDQTVSSELLYWFLLKSGSFGTSSIGADRFTSAEVADTDGDGLNEFIDAWGNPLRFYRWPTAMVDYDAPGNPGSSVGFDPILTNLSDATDTRVINSNERLYANVLIKGLPTAPSVLPNGALPRDMLFTDPDDPIGRLYSEMERLDGTNGKPDLGAEYSATLWYHTPETYHTPLIVSAGVDESLGLNEPSNKAAGGHLASVIDEDSDGTIVAAELEPLLDNLTNRNRRAGGRK